MTEPAGAPGAPDTTNTPPTTNPPSPLNMPPHPPAPPADQSIDQGAGQSNGQAAQDITGLPVWAQAELRRARSQAAKARTAPNDAAQEARQQLLQEITKALGGETAELPPEAAQALETAQHQALVRTVELAVFRTAEKAGADPNRILDSRAFEDFLADNVNADPGDQAFNGEVADAIKAFVQENPQFAAQPAGPAPAARSSAPITGGPGEGQPITEEQLGQMTPEQIAKAHREGRLNHLM